MPDATDPTPDAKPAGGAGASPAGNRNIQILAGTVFAALVAVVLIVVISGGDKGAKPAVAPTTKETVKGVAATHTLLDGIPQHGFTLGDTSKAKINIVEYLDVQCPFCRDHQLDQQPTVIDKLVRPGIATLTMQPIPLLGTQSQTGRIAVAHMAEKNLAWDFLNLWYWNQPTENTGYVTPTFLASLAAATPGATASDASTTLTPAIKSELVSIDKAGHALKVDSTPTFAIGKPGADYATYRVINPNATSEQAGQAIVDIVNKALASS